MLIVIVFICTCTTYNLYTNAIYDQALENCFSKRGKEDEIKAAFNSM